VAHRDGDVKVLSWNINCFTAERTDRKAALLEALDWDVALLQEVARAPFERLMRIDGVDGAEALALTGGEHHRRPHGAAILSRIGALRDLEVLVSLPITERFLAASIEVHRVPVRFAAWHAPNAAGDGVETKMRGFHDVGAWAARTVGSGAHVVLGADTNGWEVGWAQKPLDEDDAFAEEHRFVLEPAPHGLRDAFRAVLAADPDRLDALLARRLGSSLATTYVRGTPNRPIAERMDRVFISRGVDAHDVTHHLGDALAAGSDHAVVLADLSLASMPGEA